MKIPITERGLAPSVRRIAMSALLVGHRHHQRRDEVERRHRDDQRQDDEHHALLDLRPRGTSCGWCASSRAPIDAAGRGWPASSRGDAARAVQVVELQPHAGRPVDAEQRCASSMWTSASAAVELVVAGVEGADDGELLEARHHAGRRHLAAAARSASTLSPARTPSERASSTPSTTPNSPGTQRVERRVAQLRGEVGDLRFVRRRRCRAPARRACRRRARAAPARR